MCVPSEKQYTRCEQYTEYQKVNTGRENTVMSRVGQGNAAAGPTWISIERIILCSLKQFSPETHIKSPITNLTFITQITRYIDDNNIIKIFPKGTSPDTITTNMNKFFQSWEGLLISTGGKLSMEKCVPYAWEWRNVKGKRKIINKKVKICTETENIQIKQKQITEATKYLGIHMCPENTYKKEFETHKDEEKQFVKYIQQETLTQPEAWTTLHAIWNPKVRYYAPIVIFTDEHWEEIQKTIINAILPKLRINRKTPRDVIYGVSTYGGMGIMKYKDMQEVEMLKMIVTNMNEEEKWERLLQITLEHLYIAAGREIGILTDSPPIYLPTPPVGNASMETHLQSTTANKNIRMPRNKNTTCA